MKEMLITYCTYLIHPFKSHDALVKEDQEYIKRELSLYESLGLSWLFIILSAFFRLILISFFITLFLEMTSEVNEMVESLYSGDRYIGFYFIILSTILDVVFFPLVTLFVIQFWDLIIKFFAQICNIEGDIDKKSKNILTVALSSNLFSIVPIVGSVFQRLSQLIQMYAGLRKQLNFSAGASICVLLTPYVFIAGFISFILSVFILRML